jgi:hypothetical protein
MKKIPLLLSAILLFCMSISCQDISVVGKHYQQYNDFKSLDKILGKIDIGLDTSSLKTLLGEPVDFGFDWRYLSDSIGENGCPLGAVFTISKGVVINKDMIEICE